MLINPVDARALKMLSKYDPLAEYYQYEKEVLGRTLANYKQEYLQDRLCPSENMDYMKRHHLAFDPVEMTHDEAVNRCFEAYAQCRKKDITALFLAGFSTVRHDYRAGLSAYALMQTFPRHVFQPNEAGFCNICSTLESLRVDLTALNQERFIYGSMLAEKNPFKIQFFLQQHLTLQVVSPTVDDFAIFNRIIDTFRQAPPTAKPKDIHKQLKWIPGFKINSHTEPLLETLGFCSILETEKHKGYLHHFTNPGLAPSKSHSSDWAYPVDFWTGKDGVNEDALKFWFGDYPEVIIKAK